jgi:DNA oxidative demethylase
MPRNQALTEKPDGLEYRSDFLTEDEERHALAEIEGIDFREITMRGQTARRTVRHYGLDYGYESWQLVPTDPFPDSLEWIRGRCAAFAGVGPAELAQILVTRYPPGATIGWHRDAPMFGPTVVGVSFRSACRMRFQRTVGDVRWVYEIELAPRSGYILGGQVRSAWQHSIPPTKSLRYSVTFRTLRNPSRWLPSTTE